MCDQRNYKTVCQFWASVDDLVALDIQAKAEGVSRSALLRRLMKVYLEVRGDSAKKAERVTDLLFSRLEDSY